VSLSVLVPVAFFTTVGLTLSLYFVSVKIASINREKKKRAAMNGRVEKKHWGKKK